MLISTTTVLFIIFAPLSVIILGNFAMVPNTPLMRFSMLLAGIGVSLLSGYWALRSLGVVEAGEPLPTLFLSLFFVLFVIGLYSIVGVPLFLEVAKRMSTRPKSK